MSHRNKLFISYSHTDTRWLNAITEQLQVLEAEGLITLCNDSMLQVGDHWLEQLQEMMLRAQVGLLLVSAPFLASDFVRKEEVPRLFQRQEDAGMVLCPVLVEPCPWERVPWLANLQLRPQDARGRARALSSFQGAARKQKIADLANEIATLVGPPG